MNWIQTYAKTHLFYIIIIAIGVIAFHSWLIEHDARLQADSVVKEKQAEIASLQTQITNVQQQAAQKVKIVTQVVHDAVTPAQVIAAIPTLTNVPLATREIPGNPVDVTVAAQPLMQLVGELKTTQINLDACNQIVVLKDQQLTAKDAQIVALKKKPGFFKRVSGMLKAVGVGVGIGVLLGAHL